MSAELVPTVRLVQLRPRHVVAVAAVMIAMVLGAMLTAPGRVAACDGLSIPSVGVERCVVGGDQAEIDAGHVVRHDYFSTESVHWLAGHRSSHGSTFGALTGLSIGDQVAYRGTTWAIAEYRLVDRFQPEAVEDWMFADSPSLVLQTSATGNHVHVWMAEPMVAQMSAAAPTTTIVTETVATETVATETVATETVAPVDTDGLVAAIGQRLDTLAPVLPSLAWT